MNSFKATFLREIQKILSSKQIILILTVIPLFLCGLFVYIFQDESPRDLPISVIDYDNSKLSREFVRMLDSAPAVQVFCRSDNELIAKKDIIKGKTYAVVIIPDNFETDITKGNKPSISLKYNNQYLLTGGIIYKDVMTVFKTFQAKQEYKKLVKAGINHEKALKILNPVSIDEHVKSNPYLNYAYFLVLAALAHILQLLATFAVIWSFGTEFKDCTSKEWLKTADNSIFVAVYAKILPYLLVYTVIGVLMFLIYEACYNAPINGNLLFLFLTLPLYLLAYQSVGVLYVAITNNLRLSLSAGSFYTALGFTFAGVTYPVFAMPTLACVFANLLPIHHWLKIGLGQTLLGIPVKYQLPVCFLLVLFCILPIPFMVKLKRNALDEKCWGKY
ncbi:MAG: ABC transporter permease [Candidatus Gastranaerophilaceae bacterium]